MSKNLFHGGLSPIALQSLCLLPKVFGVKNSDDDFKCPKKLVASQMNFISTFRRSKSQRKSTNTLGEMIKKENKL